MTIPHRRLISLWLSTLLLLGTTWPCPALINPDFTPADLVKASSLILKVSITRTGEGTPKVTVVAALKGQAPATFTLHIAPELLEEISDADLIRHPGLVFVADLSKASKDSVAALSGALQIGTRWLNLTSVDGAYHAAADALDLKTVWAGSSTNLHQAVQYVLADPTRAVFPAEVGSRWRAETRLAAAQPEASPISGLLLIETQPGKPVVQVLSAGGDRLYTWGQGIFQEQAQSRGLASHSRRAAWADLNSDGNLDLASWDGKTLGLWAQQADGRFSAPTGSLPLPVCTGLVAVAAAQRQPALAVGTDGAVLVLVRSPAGLVVSTTLALPAEIVGKTGPAGPIIAADVNADGPVDLLQAYEQALVVWPGLSAGGFGPGRIAYAGTVGRELSAIEAADLDGDGRSEVIVVGRYGGGESSGASILTLAEGWTMQPIWREAGEVYKMGTRMRSVQACDLNADGRIDLVFGHERMAPQILFNRGFATFGTAGEMSLPGQTLLGPDGTEIPLASGEALGASAPFCAVGDLDGDGQQDAVFASAAGEIWALWTACQGPAFGLTLALPPDAAGPVRTQVGDGPARLGGLHALPGRPAYRGLRAKGSVTVTWTGADLTPRSAPQAILKPAQRLVLKP